MTATAPAGSGTVDVTATVQSLTSGTSSADQFTYIPAPTITSVSPTAGLLGGGTTVTVSGTNLSGATVTFGPNPATNVVVNSAGTSLTATSPAGTGTVDVQATTLGGTSATSAKDQFTYEPPPTVSSISPTAGPAAGGTVVTVAGTNLTGATVGFGPNPATNVSVNSAGTSLTATSPAGTGTVDVQATTPVGTSMTSTADQFTYVPAPTVATVSPAKGLLAGGQVITVTGTNLTGATVGFGPNPATNVVVNSAGTSLTATSPAGTGTVDVRATTLGGTSAIVPGDKFTYVPKPTVTAVTPNTGPVAGGTVVTVTGTNLAGSVKFGPNAATKVTINGAGTSLTATSPAGSGTVNVTVTSAGGISATSSADDFTYLGTPTVISISPSSGTTGGGTVVTVTGTNLAGETGVSFGSNSATNVTVNAAGTSLKATSPAGSGTVDVQVTNPIATSTAVTADQFTYVNPTVKIANVSGNEGTTGTNTVMNFPVTLSGPSSATVTVSYQTADGTAQAGSDYVAASGTLTFSPGITSADHPRDDHR